MDWTSIERSWHHYKALARERWDRLSDREIEATMGKHESLSRCVQKAYELSREEAERRISVWLARQLPPPAANR